MTLVIPRGSIHSPFWLLLDKPSEADEGAGSLLTGSEGYHFDKLIQEVGLPDPYITCISQNTLVTYDSSKTPLDNFLDWLRASDHKPVLIGLYGSVATQTLSPETKNYKKSKNGQYEAKLDKWAGSLLVSPCIAWPHYCIPLWEVTQFFIDWSYRDIYKFIDLGHIKEEYDFWASNGFLNPLPTYNIVTNPTFSQVVDWISYCGISSHTARDIETIRPPKSRKDTAGIVGHMYTVALAPNTREAMSFQLWNWSKEQRRIIWTKLNEFYKTTTTIGQNFFQFDSHYEEAYGLEPCIERIEDTRIRHHILWPELPHSLQFQTRQYTRQKYYKDEGKTWSPKDLKKLLGYGGLDVLVDYKIWEEQENEFRERPQLI